MFIFASWAFLFFLSHGPSVIMLQRLWYVMLDL